MTKTEVDYRNPEYKNLNEKDYSNANKGHSSKRKRVERPREEHHYHYYPNNKLYRSTRDKWLGGVCGGIAEHFNKSPNVIRLLWIILTIVSFGVGVFAYIAFLLIVDKYPANYTLPPRYPEHNYSYQSRVQRRSVHIHYE